MDYSEYDLDQLIERINELEVLNKQLLREKEQETMLDFAWSGNLGNWYWNRKTNTVICNQLKVTTLGYTMDEMPPKITQQFFTEKLHPDDYQNTMHAMTLHLEGKASVYETEYRIQAKDKSWKWFYDRGKITQRDSKGKPVMISGIVFDITARKEEELALKKENESIYIDDLTKSTNKRTFKEKAEKLRKDKSQKYAFIVMDIDNFKLINDIFGYSGGDSLLIHIANTLFVHIKENEVYGRITGDKFYLFLSYAAKSQLESRIKKITDDILIFKFDSNTSFNIVVVSGIYVIEDSSITIDMISDRASLAAKMIKGGYASACSFYNDAIRNQILNDNEIENEMHEGLENKDFKVFLQPKFNVKTEKIVGAEALIRWHHPRKGIIHPNSFIPLFEKNGFVTEIDMFVFEEICKMQKAWKAEGRKPLIISVNMSRLHLNNPAFVANLTAISEKYDVRPEVMELELTESTFSGNMGIVLDVTRKLHNIGFRLSIDDFGSAYSSFNMLKDIFIDVVKIDREFFNETTSTIRGKTIVKSIVKMAKDLEIEIVAEGIETMEQVDFLCEIGCDLAQGFYYAKPMPISDFIVLLDKKTRSKRDDK
ncbi:GGDEF and EAL domain-containing protein [Acetobacterium tundrae]|uniref:EAL domain-containing protein n=1 Tax=Acetobacterium tundrae TaxID=132932 RepID=A0ABR6WN38_9FIRM|nr:GGDEF and EAL domain-containing protein [Acetobacterium tundrae]MBC3797698.1 EAL domain-containing protein [Acetobacterium tundrae]